MVIRALRWKRNQCKEKSNLAVVVWEASFNSALLRLMNLDFGATRPIGIVKIVRGIGQIANWSKGKPEPVAFTAQSEWNKAMQHTRGQWALPRKG